MSQKLTLEATPQEIDMLRFGMEELISYYYRCAERADRPKTQKLFTDSAAECEKLHGKLTEVLKDRH